MTHTRGSSHSWCLLGSPIAFALVLCGGCTSQSVSPPSVTPTMLQTQQDEAARLKANEQKLDGLLNELNTSLPAIAAQQLTQNQARWASLARDECSWQRDLSGGGSMAPVVYLTCMDQRILNRIDWLKSFLCEGYGSTGECAASRRY